MYNVKEYKTHFPSENILWCILALLNYSYPENGHTHDPFCLDAWFTSSSHMQYFPQRHTYGVKARPQNVTHTLCEWDELSRTERQHHSFAF